MAGRKPPAPPCVMMVPVHHAESTSILYAEQRQGLFAVALAIVRDAALAEDAVHDGVHRVLARGRPPEGDPVAFLYASVRNAAIDLTRRRRVRRAAPLEEALFDDRQADPLLRAIDREIRSASKGRKSLDDVARALAEADEAVTRARFDTLVAAAKKG